MSNNRVLVIAAHPDDEVIGCGGTIAVHVARGDDAYVLFMADGVSSRGYDPNCLLSRQEELASNAGVIERRKRESILALELLGVPAENCIHLGLADQRLDTYPFLALVKHIENVKNKILADIVYTHFGNDFNLDHCLTARAVFTAFRPFCGKSVSIRCFEIPESTGLSLSSVFSPDCFCDISDCLDVKMRALAMYESEHVQEGHPRSLRSLRETAQARGIQSGVKFAEAFQYLWRQGSVCV